MDRMGKRITRDKTWAVGARTVLLLWLLSAGRVAFTCCQASEAQGQNGLDSETLDAMTQVQAQARIPQRMLPPFWVGDMETLDERMARIRIGQVQEMARSPGDRPIQWVSYGERESVQRQANYNSAVGGHLESAYMDKQARQRPVILFVGPVHGHEVEGLTGLVNLIKIMETGQDLRAKRYSELRALGRRCRLLIVPTGNPDGVARMTPRALQGMGLADVRFWGQGTWSDHRFCGWPESKRQHPMQGDNVGFLGCYFNDAGINPMHDEFFQPMGPEAPAILNLAREEGPDLAVSLHSHASNPALLRPAYVTTECQEAIRQLAGQYYALLKERGLPFGSVFSPQAEGGEHPAPFNLTSALTHVSGADSFTFECPHGLSEAKACQVSFNQILDIQLTLYEAMIRYALEQNNGN